ncbi:hypothetical protein, partial [Rhodoblastus acidophilus]|uniref:hypothetical protein n=1 Tax=Rhodoblastus acidophilus TaxID=1074 RepID=UPI0011B0B49B
MAIPSWPAINYAIQQGSWQCPELSLAPLTSDMNAGTTRRRNKYTLRISKMQFVVSMTSAQLEVFKSFYFSTLSNGAARFTMPIWNGSAYVTRACAFQKDKVPAVQNRGLGY